MDKLTSRERVKIALNHQEPDRVPVDIGGGSSTSIVVEGYEKLRDHLGLPAGKTKILSKAFRAAKIDEDVVKKLGVDVIPVNLKGASKAQSGDSKNRDTFRDGWGVVWEKVANPYGYYWEVAVPPLKDAAIEDLEKHNWPDPEDPKRIEGLAEEVKYLYQNTDYALMGGPVFKSLWELAYMLRGFDTLLMDLYLNPDFVHALFRKITDIDKKVTDKYLKVVGRYIQVVRGADDLATQDGLLFSPEMYRKFIKPYQAEYFAFVKERTDAKVFYHSCGDVGPLINDLIEIGVDVLNPVQVSTKTLGDTARLKEEFGDRISFWGGIDTQEVLPAGSPEQVEEEIKRRIKDLGPGGGYVVASVHNIQPDVPAENICRMVEAAHRFGEYPVTTYGINIKG